MAIETVIRLPALSPAEDAKACLVFVEGHGTVLGQRVALDAEIVIGRDPTCAVRLDGDDVSRRHARVAPEGDGHVVGDLGSLNGTWVNGLEVELRRLSPGIGFALVHTSPSTWPQATRRPRTTPSCTGAPRRTS